MPDADGYPTESELDVIRRFEGSPKALGEYMMSLIGGMGFVLVEDATSEFGNRPLKKMIFITGGWSGCEDAFGILENATEEEGQFHPTVFRMRFWESTHRGGKIIYEIPAEEFEKEQYLGDIFHAPKTLGSVLKEERNAADSA